jgi:hypothetical protein
VFAENVARHEKEIAQNLATPTATLMKNRKKRIAQDKASYKKMLVDAKAEDAEKQKTVQEQLSESVRELRAKKKKGVK